MTKGSKPAGAWKPGQSGNPAWRKPGTGAVANLRAAIAKDVPDIIASLTVAAKAGDVTGRFEAINSESRPSPISLMP